MDSEEKILNIEAQVRAIRRMHEVAPDSVGTIVCPYCGGENAESIKLCCDTLRKALAAVVIKLQAETDVEFFERLQEGIEKQAKHARN